MNGIPLVSASGRSFAIILSGLFLCLSQETAAQAGGPKGAEQRGDRRVASSGYSAKPSLQAMRSFPGRPPSFMMGGTPLLFATGKSASRDGKPAKPPAEDESAAQTRKRRFLRYALQIVGGIAVVGGVLMIVVMWWGHRLRKRLRQRSSSTTAYDPLWYLKPGAIRKSSPPAEESPTEKNPPGETPPAEPGKDPPD